MSKSLAAVAFVVGALIAAPAAYFFARMKAEDEIATLRRQSEQNLLRAQTAEESAQNAQAELARLKSSSTKDNKAAKDIAGEHDRLANEKGDAIERADKAEAAARKAKADKEELERTKNAELAKLRDLLEKNNIFEHLTPEEIAARLKDGEEKFRAAFASKDKATLMKALQDLQKLGPTAFDKVIELWKLAADDYGIGENWGKGPNTMGMTMMEYVSLIWNYGLVKYGIMDAKDEAFRINSLYGLPWWTSESAADRAKLAGEALLNSSGGTTEAAIDALSGVGDPSTVRYLSDYLSRNSDNADARKSAIRALTAKNTPEAWAAIEKAAASDSDEGVRQAAKQALLIKNTNATGLLITWVDPNGQGALAGIKVGDVMTSYNGVAIKKLSDVNEAKKTVAADASAPVKLMRGSDIVEITLAPGQIGINGVAVTAK